MTTSRKSYKTAVGVSPAGPSTDKPKFYDGYYDFDKYKVMQKNVLTTDRNYEKGLDQNDIDFAYDFYARSFRDHLEVLEQIAMALAGWNKDIEKARRIEIHIEDQWLCTQIMDISLPLNNGDASLTLSPVIQPHVPKYHTFDTYL